MPASLAEGIHGHYQVGNALSWRRFERACKAFQAEWGQVDRLIGYLKSSGAHGRVRSRLDIPGAETRRRDELRDKYNEGDSAGCWATRRQAKANQQCRGRRLFAEGVGYPIVLKPLAGVGSKNTMRVSNERLMGALNLLLPSEKAQFRPSSLCKARSIRLSP